MGKAVITITPGESTATIERTFDAPRDKVFKAMTTKELIEKWWVGPGFTTTVEEYNPHDGGTWKFLHVKGDEKYHFFGVFHEVSPERVIQTFEFDGLPERGHVIMQRMELTETSDGKTKMRITETYFSVADRDGMYQTGAEAGLNASYDALDKVLAEL
ncbi:MAG TPA: SRPBCC domain-containing protein [Candidatus Saccharimonadia bacterium]|nr:SRPBCC domain-containing protein [Candidatus Saccharimonadia bacterium]